MSAVVSGKSPDCTRRGKARLVRRPGKRGRPGPRRKKQRGEVREDRYQRRPTARSSPSTRIGVDVQAATVVPEYVVGHTAMSHEKKEMRGPESVGFFCPKRDPLFSLSSGLRPPKAYRTPSVERRRTTARPAHPTGLARQARQPRSAARSLRRGRGGLIPVSAPGPPEPVERRSQRLAGGSWCHPAAEGWSGRCPGMSSRGGRHAWRRHRRRRDGPPAGSFGRRAQRT